MYINKKKIYSPADDPQFQKPYIDNDERKVRDGYNIRFIHGGFEGTNVKFLFCFPEPELYRGRFFQYLSPFPGPNEEYASLDKKGADDKIIFAVSHGAYFVESNMGAAQALEKNSEPTLIYRSCAAVAEYSRRVAVGMYGGSRPYGYVYGGSGGGYKAISCIENTDAFDGAVPYVIGAPVALPNVISARAHAERILRRVIPKIAEALEPGGSGDPYEGLNEEEKQALEEITKFGLPLRTWLQWRYYNDGALPVLLPGVKVADPEYFKVFWTEPGYLGSVSDGSAQKDRINIETTVEEVFLPGSDKEGPDGNRSVHEAEGKNRVNDAWQKMLRQSKGKPSITVKSAPTGNDLYLRGCCLSIKSGEAAGFTLNVDGLDGNKIIIGRSYGQVDIISVLSKLKPGDKVLLDNSDYIAIQTYHRHQVPEMEYTTWDQYRDENGQPIYPQRSNIIGKAITYSGAGSIQDGRIQGKVIVVACLEDEFAYPWQADWYKRKVAQVNPGKEQDIFRLWYMEHCNHGDVSVTQDDLTLVPYLGAVHQALLSLSDWVEKGIEPTASSVYRIDNGQVIAEPDIKSRKGIQPVVRLLADGGNVAQIKQGQTVSFEAYAEVPCGRGEVTAIDFSFEGEKDYPVKGKILTVDGGSGVVARVNHTYDKPGTYYAVARVKSNLEGNAEDIFTQICNLDRVKIVVK